MHFSPLGEPFLAGFRTTGGNGELPQGEKRNRAQLCRQDTPAAQDHHQTDQVLDRIQTGEKADREQLLHVQVVMPYMLSSLAFISYVLKMYSTVTDTAFRKDHWIQVKTSCLTPCVLTTKCVGKYPEQGSVAFSVVPRRICPKTLDILLEAGKRRGFQTTGVMFHPWHTVFAPEPKQATSGSSLKHEESGAEG